MSMQISLVQNGTTPQDEYVLISVLSDVNTSGYALIDETYNASGTVSDIHRHFFKFPNLTVKKGDFIVIYTCQGKSDHYQNQRQSTTYRLYWGEKACIWNNKTVDTAELLKTQTVSKKSTK